MYLVYISYPVCSLQSAFCIERICIAVFVRASLKSGPKYRDSKKYGRYNMGAMIDVWTVCLRAPVEKHKDRAMITLYQLKTNGNARLNNMAASDTPLRDHSVCWNELATGPLGVDILASQFKLHF